MKLLTMIIYFPVMIFIVADALRRKNKPQTVLFLIQMVGATLNFTAVLANGLRMPVDVRWFREDWAGNTHKLLDPETARLVWLTDIWPPIGLSIGDVLIAVPVAVFIAAFLADLPRRWRDADGR